MFNASGGLGLREDSVRHQKLTIYEINERKEKGERKEKVTAIIIMIITIVVKMRIMKHEFSLNTMIIFLIPSYSKFYFMTENWV